MRILLWPVNLARTRQQLLSYVKTGCPVTLGVGAEITIAPSRAALIFPARPVVSRTG